MDGRMSETAFLTHRTDLNRLMSFLSEGECCSVVALSNMGKSALLRNVSSPVEQVHPTSKGPPASTEDAGVAWRFSA
jgi:ABC-type phosphate/phosphonate transport system ATPase subunit